MSDDFQSIFEGLDDSQIRAVLDAMKAKAQGFKAPQGPGADFAPQNAEEAAIAQQALDGARQQIEARRMQPRIDEYKSSMRAARGNKSALRQIKERYRAQGVPVDTVDFS